MSMEIALRKATRLDYNPPKTKHLDTIVSLTFHNPAIIVEMLDLLERRHRENSWIISFKVLVIFHLLMRKGNGDRTLEYVNKHPSALDTTRLREKSSGVVHIQNIYLYTAYLQQKVAAFREIGSDCVRTTMANKTGRLRHLSVANGLLRETQVLQKQLAALLKCKFILDDVDNSISLYAFRLLVKDLLVLFQTINEGVVNILEHYFAMVKSDARISLEIYRRFARQTEDTIEFLGRVLQMQHDLPDIHVPNLKHAPLSLATALEEYLLDLKDKPAQESTSPPLATPSLPPPKPIVAIEKPAELVDFFAHPDSSQSVVVSSMHTPVPVATGQHNPFRTDVNPFRASLYPTSPVSLMPLTSARFEPPPQPAMTFAIPAATISSNPFLQNTQHRSPALVTQNNNPFAVSPRPTWDTSIF